jgi:dTDP-4-amino-4,6-dideoxygalactose transaminase
MAAIARLADEHGFAVIEDASHAIGAAYQGAPVGSCAFSDIAVFSFHPVKIITTGEGGMAVTNDAELAHRMDLRRSHGITRDPQRMVGDPDGAWYYQQIDLGFNYRMTDLQAALGTSQMRRLDEFVARRHEIAAWYDEHLAALPLDLPERPAATYSSLHLYVVRLQPERIQRSHRDVFDALRADGIGVNLHYIPVHLQPYYAALGFARGHCPAAERYYDRAITIPMHPGLTTADLEAVRAALARSVA